jgi:F0F1-type ATP synthase membrane subunit b/b'
MATATKKPPARKKAEKGTLDYLELALENLNQAREHAQHDLRTQIDALVGTIKDVAAEARRRTHG